MAERWGTVTSRQAETSRRPVAIVADSSADLPDAVLDRHHIALVPLQVTFGDDTYRDRVGLKPAEFYRMLRAAKTANLDQVHLFDSKSASLGPGMLALRAAELAESGWGAKAIVTELDRARRQSGLFLTVDTYENLCGRAAYHEGKHGSPECLTSNRFSPWTPMAASFQWTGFVAGTKWCSGFSAWSNAPSLRDPNRSGSGSPMPRPRRSPNESEPRWWPRTGRATASYRWQPVSSALMRAWAPGRYAIRSRTERRHVRNEIPMVNLTRSMASLPEAVRHALEAADDRKARDILTLDLRGLTNTTDFFVVASGTSDAHVRGVADSVLERMHHLGVHAHHVEGLQGGRWALLDYFDFVVHVFHPEARAFYQLERLWNDAPVVAFAPTSERKA